MKNLFYKIHKSNQGRLLAVCDKNLAGKKLKDDKKQIEFFVNPRFYQEDSGDDKTIKELLLNSVDANMVGEKAVGCGLDLGLVKPENVTKISGVPHAIFSIILK